MLRSDARVLHSSSSKTCVCGATGMDMVFIVISFWQVHVRPTSCRENESLWYIFSIFMELIHVKYTEKFKDFV